MRLRRLAPLLGVLLAGCGASAHTPVAPPAAPAPTGALDRLPPKRGTWPVLYAEQQAAERRRRAQLARARRSPTVQAALRVARLTGRISPTQEGRMRRQWIGANAVLSQLTGVSHSELGYVVGSVNALAAAHLLTADRLEPAFLALNANTRFWPGAAIPAAGWRTSFGDDPVVFQYYPGRGLQIQPLGSWGKANALAAECLRQHCRRAALTRSLDRLSSLAVRRSGYLAWEYYFAYGTGAPPWVSGMTQATATQALSRGYRALGVKRWRRTALRALGAFELPSPRGVALPVPGGRHYLLYSFAPDHVVLNGGLQAVIGLHDTAELTHSGRAQRLFRAGDRAARREVAGFDTGAWSLYSAGGAESTFSYHDLLAGFLGRLCDRVHAQVYCRTYESFERYEHEPPRIGLAPLSKLHADRVTSVRFSLSKVSDVRVRVWGRRGTSLTQELQLPRGEHSVAWVPRRRGTYKLRIEARGPSGPIGVKSRVLKVKLPKPPKKKKAAPRKKPDAAPETRFAGP